MDSRSFHRFSFFDLSTLGYDSYNTGRLLIRLAEEFFRIRGSSHRNGRSFFHLMRVSFLRRIVYHDCCNEWCRHLLSLLIDGGDDLPFCISILLCHKVVILEATYHHKGTSVYLVWEGLGTSVRRAWCLWKLYKWMLDSVLGQCVLTISLTFVMSRWYVNAKGSTELSWHAFVSR